MMTVPDINKASTDVSNFRVVGIGSPDGRLDILKKIFSDIPLDSGMSYIVAVPSTSYNLDNLSEILSQYTLIPVQEIINDINLEPNQVYIMPENNILSTQDGVLKLKRITRNVKRNNNTDVFFESLAEIHKSRLIEVMLLSDSGFEGATGFKKVKEEGGVTIIENPKISQFKTITQKFIDTYTADYVIGAEDIPLELLQIQKIDKTNYAYNEDEIFNQIIDLISLKSANDFKNYKYSALGRRIAIRMVKVQKDDLETYYNFLRNNKAEQDILFHDFLIPVTCFFRDSEYFKSLIEVAIPPLVQNSTTNSLRIWVPGCSTGEEAYSLAIAIHEFLLETNNSQIKVQIFASDLSENSISKARNAAYSNVDVQYIADERLQNYFVKSNGQYHVKKVIRDMCVFAVHNFVKDAPLAKIDLISCRNVLTYFNPFLQIKALTSFHHALKDKGILFVGKSETVILAQDLFENIVEEENIYVRKSAPNYYISEVITPVQNDLEEKIKATDLKKNQKNGFQKVLSNILFSKYMPAGVIIDGNLEIVHFHGDTSPFLSPSSGKPSFNILKMVDENIKSELHNTIIKVKSEKKNIRRDNIRVKKQSHLASFEVVLFQNDNEHLMILFYKIPLEEESNTKLTQKDQDQKSIELEVDLSQIYENSKQTETVQKTDNKELETISEELKKTARELESTQEELHFINYELKETQKQRNETINFSESIIKTIHEPLVIIDKNFLVKNANTAFYNIFKTTEIEIEGEHLLNIGQSKWNSSELKEQINKVIHSKEVIDNYKVTMIDEVFVKKTLIVNGRLLQNSTEELILLAFNDISELINVTELLLNEKLEIQKYNHELETFTSAASDNLHEPLRKIHMFSKRTFENEKNISELGKHDLERVQCLTLNMSKLIEDVIHYSRANFLEKEYKRTDLNNVLKKCIKDLKDIITKKNVSITFKDLPVLNIIPDHIQQLFISIIINSIKYSKQEVIPQIKIEAQPTSTKEIIEIGGNPEERYAKICVIDNGIGFDKAYEAKIFEPFYRVHDKEHFKGSGLGLTLAKKIVANHRGFIKSMSEKNQGTIVAIYFPIYL